MHILSFDIEDWFHILDNPSTADEMQWLNLPSRLETGVYRILDLLDTHQQKASFFCLGWIAERYPDVIKEIAARGHEIGTHSYAHQLVYSQTPRQFKDDLHKSIGILEEITGRKIEIYRAPGFSITEQTKWAFGILLEEGIKTDCSVFPSSRAHGGYPGFPHQGPCILDVEGAPLLELPMNTARLLITDIVFSGGGYFRLLPGTMVQRLSSGKEYVMTYFHPRDFDPGQPMIPGLPIHRRFKSYVGLKTALGKLSKWIGQENFTTVAELTASLDTNKLPRLKVDYTSSVTK